MLPSSQSTRAAARRAWEGRPSPCWGSPTSLAPDTYTKLGKEMNESMKEATDRYFGRHRELALGVLLVHTL